MPELPPEAKAGEPVRADHQNMLREAVLAIGLAVARPLAAKPSSSGTGLILELPEEFDVRITGAPTSGRHPWRQVVRLPATHAWADGPRLSDASTDPVYEYNGKTIPVGTRVRVRRDEGSGELLVQADAC